MISGKAGMYYEIYEESNAPCNTGPLAELIVEDGGQAQGVEEQKLQKEKQERSEEEEGKQGKTVIRDQEIVGEVGKSGGVDMHLVELLEGRGICEGTLTPQSLNQRSPWRIREPDWKPWSPKECERRIG